MSRNSSNNYRRLRRRTFYYLLIRRVYSIIPPSPQLTYTIDHLSPTNIALLAVAHQTTDFNFVSRNPQTPVLFYLSTQYLVESLFSQLFNLIYCLMTVF